MRYESTRFSTNFQCFVSFGFSFIPLPIKLVLIVALQSLHTVSTSTAARQRLAWSGQEYNQFHMSKMVIELCCRITFQSTRYYSIPFFQT